MPKPVPYYDLGPQHTAVYAELKQVFDRVLNSSSFILGKEVEDFERAFSKYCGSKFVIGVNSGTSALHLALKVLDLGPGDEVITTPFTFAASAWAISYVGAKPVFVDIEPDYFNIDPAKIEKAINKKTKAIMPVHLYGHPCDLDPILDLCEEHDLYLVEDAAQAHGASYQGQSVGTFGHLGIYSFYPTKNLGTCGEGGAVVTDDPDLADRVKLLRNHGSVKRYEYEEVGYNYRMEGLQGGFLGVKLKYLKKWNENRLEIATYYQELLKSLDLPIRIPEEAPWGESAYHLFTLAVKDRERLCKHMEASGVGYSKHYAKPMHLQTCYKNLGYKPGDLPVAERAAEEVLNLPIFPGMKKSQIERVVEVLKDFYKA